MVAADGEDDSAVVEYARYLGIEPHEDAALMHIAREAVVAELPPGWEEHTDDDGNPFYFNEKEDRSIWEHPCDAHYRNLVLQGRQPAERPSKAVPGAQSMLLESSASPANSSAGPGSPPTVRAAALPQPTTEVKALKPTADVDDTKYLNAIGIPEARIWWAEHVGRNRVRTRQLAKVLAAWMMDVHKSTCLSNSPGPVTSEADEVVINSSTTREHARTIATAMEKEEGNVSAEDFGAFAANTLQGSFSLATLRSIARKLQPRRTGGAKRRQQASPTGRSAGQATRTHMNSGNAHDVNAEMRAFEMSRDSRASAVLERQRASPIAVKYAVMGAASGHDPTAVASDAVRAVGVTVAPAVSAIHRELLAPLTGSEKATQGAISRGVVPAQGTAAAGLGRAMSVNSGSPVRLPSLESSPVLMKSDDVDGSVIEHLEDGGSINKFAAATADPLKAVVGLGSRGNSGNARNPVLIGQGGQQWRGNLTGSGGAVAGRWPARHKFSMTRTRQRSEKLQPVGTAMANGSALSSTGVAEVGASVRDVDPSIDEHDYLDGKADGSIDQAW